jgi:hypothetical protein
VYWVGVSGVRVGVGLMMGSCWVGVASGWVGVGCVLGSF